MTDTHNDVQGEDLRTETADASPELAEHDLSPVHGHRLGAPEQTRVRSLPPA